MLPRARKSSPKKSEKIEIRLSHEDKLALHGRASESDTTVSEIVRGLIQTYLGTPIRTERAVGIRKAPALLAQTFFENPRKVTAALFSALGLSLFAMPSAIADPITLELEGKFEQGDDETLGGQVFSSTLSLEPGETSTFVIDAADATDPSYSVDVTASLVAEEEVIIEFKIVRGLEDGEVIDAPTLIMHTDSQASASFGNGGETFQLTATLD